MSALRSVRIGVAGVGLMGGAHAREIALGKITAATLTAVCDTEPAALARFPAVPGFADHRALIASGTIDALLIATPHYQHTPLAIDALGAGLHVLTEKPLAVHQADALQMLAAHERCSSPRPVFAEMLNLRAEPRFLKLRQLISSGQLGSVRRIHWTITDCFRTDAYYRAGGWRATWQGEGGGVLLNQCPHQLDLWQWLFGMPARVHAFCGFGRFHEIEVEDQVTAYLEYEQGTNGVFVASTAEAPGTNRLEVVGDLGQLQLDSDGLRLTRNAVSSVELLRNSPDPRGVSASSSELVLFGRCPSTRNVIIQNFVNAILEGEPLIAPASEGLASVALANAMIYSGLTRQTVQLPLDPALYAAELGRLIEAARP